MRSIRNMGLSWAYKAPRVALSGPTHSVATESTKWTGPLQTVITTLVYLGMGRNSAYWLTEGSHSQFFVPKACLFLAVLFLAVYQCESASSFKLDPKFMIKCTDQLQCGSKGLICLNQTCQYVYSLQQTLVSCSVA